MDTKTRKRSSRLASLAAAAATLGLSVTLLAQPALASHVTPSFVDFNINSCEDLGLPADTPSISLGSLDVQSGEHTYTSGDLSITITADADLKHFSFEDASPPVLAVAVKAADGAYIYDYRPDGATEDDGLITPNTGGNDPSKPQAGLSHLFVCFGEEAEETPTPTPVQTPVQTPESSVAGSTSTPEQSVQGATGTPEPSQPDTAMLTQNGPSAIPTVAFALILVAALGTLAWANVKSARSRA